MKLLDAVRGFRQLRDKKKSDKKEFEEAQAPANEMMEKLKGFFLDQLNTNGAESLKTVEGTIHKTTKTSYVVEDQAALWAHLVLSDDQALVKLSMVKDNVEQFMADNNGELPPGVTMKKFIDIGVRAPTKKSAK